MTSYIDKVKKLVSDEIKQNGRFCHHGKSDIQMSDIHMIDPFNMDENGHITFNGSWQLTIETIGNLTRFALFSGTANFSNDKVELQNPIRVDFR